MHLALVIEATPERVFDSLLTEQTFLTAEPDSFSGSRSRRVEWRGVAPGPESSGELRGIRKDELLSWSQDWPAPVDAEITLAALAGPATWLTFSSKFLDPADENTETKRSWKRR